MTDEQWVPIGSASDFAEGTVKTVEVGDRKLAVSNVGGEVYSLDAQCPHRGGPLDCGELRGNGELVCPWHHFRYDARTGVSTMPPDAYATKAHPTRVTDGTVEVLLAGGARG